MISDTQVFLPILTKVLIATLCGSLIGLDREIKQKVAGIRTFMLICVGCCILTATSFLIPNSDPTRIIAQIITGVGFLGGGVIYKSDDRIYGVTTASFIWVASALGILVGCGFVILPISLTVGLILMSILLQKIEDYIKSKIKSTESPK